MHTAATHFPLYLILFIPHILHYILNSHFYRLTQIFMIFREHSKKMFSWIFFVSWLKVVRTNESTNDCNLKHTKQYESSLIKLWKMSLTAHLKILSIWFVFLMRLKHFQYRFLSLVSAKWFNKTESKEVEYKNIECTLNLETLKTRRTIANANFITKIYDGLIGGTTYKQLLLRTKYQP